MSMSLQDLAFGELRKEASGERYGTRLIGVADTDAMPAEARRFLEAHLTDVMERSEEYGQCQPGWWVDQRPPAEIAELLPEGQQDFAIAVTNALDRLRTATPGTASPGLLAFVRFVDEQPFLAILKLDMSDRDLYQFASQAQAEGVIQYQQLLDVLPTSTSGLRKVALIPNPAGGASDLRVIDNEASEGTATYWLQFLGARVVPPAPKVVKALLAITRTVMSERAGQDEVQRGIARAVEEIGSTEPTTPRRVVEHAAEEAGVEPDQVWEEVAARAGHLLPEQAVISSRSLERVVTEIQFHAGGQLVTVRGPAEALEGRFGWVPAVTGFQLTIATDDVPQVTTRSKPGR